MSKKKKISYLVRFEEMIESRIEAIENCEKVLTEQEYLITVLEEHDSSKEEKHFEKLINEIKGQILELKNYINSLKEKNINTEKLLNILKSSKNYNEICTLICDELGIFNNEEQTEGVK